MEKKSHDAVDLFKWLCAWLVVYIHLSPVITQFPVVDMLIGKGISKIAVPFFFAASALLLFRKMGNPKTCKKHNHRTLRKFCGNILLIYTIWVVVYTAYKVFHRYYNNDQQETLSSLLWGFFFGGTQYHLWYLVATLCAAPAVYLLWRLGRKWLIVACLVGHVLQCLDQPYHFSPVFDLPVIIMLRSRFGLQYAAVLHGIPLMCLGVLCLEDYKKRSSRQWLIRLPGMLAIFLTEVAILLLVQGEKLAMDKPLSVVPLVYYLTNWLFSLDFRFPVKWLGKALRFSSVWIYCVHPLAQKLYHWVFSYDGGIRFLIIGGMSFLSGAVYVAVKLLWQKHKRSAFRQIDKCGTM